MRGGDQKQRTANDFQTDGNIAKFFNRKGSENISS